MTTPASEPNGPTEPDSTPTEQIEPAAAEAPVTVAAPAAPARPPSNVGWAVASLVLFWPLAFSAFTHALNVFPLWSEGDAAGAQYASKRARWLGIVSLWIGGALIVIFAVLYLLAMLVLVHHGHHHHMQGWHQPMRPMAPRQPQ